MTSTNTTASATSAFTVERWLHTPQQAKGPMCRYQICSTPLSIGAAKPSPRQ
ncbi:hypothetical protein [Nocardia brasiliensis]|uniref:hypothetical protein n=1 Tax=Nocardia brasiliensis TaxID=37326 RepID=UPI001895C706|nr:hypothetical protein [Nocardia brasiliensis]MBF6547030.1 hypothetical protein [Nocardia brasiliensis]